MAGKNRANTLSAILSNMSDLEGAYSDALKAEGSALKENEAYLDSIQGRIDLFNNSLQTMWMNLISTDTVKGIVDIGTALMKLLDTTHGKILAVAAAFLIYKKLHDKTTFTEMYNGVIKAITSLITVTNQATKADVASMLAKKGCTQATIDQIVADAGLAKVKGALTAEQIKTTASTLAEAYASGKLTAAQYLAAASTLGLKTAVQALGKVLKANWFYLIAAAVAAAALAFDRFHTTVHEAAEAAKEAFEEIQNVVEATESTIQSLESELSTLQDKIDELDGKKLSFAEDQELERLKDQRAELEHSLRVQQQLLELQKDASNKQAVATMQAYTKAASAGAEKTQETAKTWGTIGGVIAGVVATAGILLAPLTGGASLAATLGMSGTAVAGGILAGGAALGLAGNKAGEAIGSKRAANDGTYDSWYKTYTDALDAARKDEQEALEKYQKDSSNIDKLDKWQEAQQRTAEIETEMYNHLSQMQEYYSGLEYGISDEIDKELDTWYNFLDKLAIDQKASGAEVTALDRIFGENASQEIQNIKQQILDASKSGKSFNFTAAINSSQELSDTLQYLGLDVQDVIDYFTQLGEAAEEAANGADTSFVDVATDVSKVADAISGVIDALDEFKQNGMLSHGTILSLAEFFNTDKLEDEYDKYLEVMLSGNASLEEAKAATSALAQAYLQDAITAEPLTADKKNAMVGLLKNLGITNADELIEHELQKSAIAAIGNELAKDSTLTDNSEAIQEIINKYGVEIQAVDELIAKLKEKQALESNVEGVKKQEEAYKAFANEYDSLWRYAQNLSENMPDAPTNPYDLTLANTTSGYAANATNAYPMHSGVGYAANMRKAYVAPDGSTMWLSDSEYAAMIQKYEEYQKKQQELQEYWNKLQALQSSAEGQKWVNADGTLKEGVSEEFEKQYNEAQAAVENMENTIEAEFTLEYDLHLQEELDANTVSALTEAVEQYKATLAETSEVVSDGQVVSDEFKASLLDLGIGVNELNKCFDETHPLVVKDAKALNNLVKSTQKNISQNIKLAKSQAQLEYYELIKELNATLKVTDKLDDATKDVVESTLDQIDAVKLAIYQYQLLEDSLLGVTNAFEKFAKAQEIDAMNTYGDSYVEMAQTMYDAIFKTGEVGSEAFWAAVEATVPDNIYKKFYEEADQLQAIIDYLGTHVFPTLTLEEDQFSLGYENMEDFVQECLKVGVFVGDLSNFDLAEGMNFEKATELLDMTETQAYALFSTLDKFNGNNSEPSFLMQLDDSLAGRITLVTSELEELNRQKLALLENGITGDEQGQIDTINQKLNQCESDMNTLGKEAYNTWQEYTQNEAALAALSQVENKQDELTAEGAAKLGIELEEGQVLTVQQAYDMLLAKKLGLEEPCVLTAQLAIDNINSEIADIESTLNSQDFSNVDPVSVGLEIGASTEDVKAALNEKLQGLKEDKLAIATEFNIELPEEEKQKLMEELGAVEDFKINDKEFAVICNGISETQQALQGIQDFVIDNKSYTVTQYVETVDGGNQTSGSKTTAKSHKVGVTRQHMVLADGTAHADGSWGAPKTETALVGELGPELLVRNGRWTTIGDNGAEFTQVKKGDIIFNHKQTEDLLSKGYITGRGKAYAGGTAYSNMFGPLKPDDPQSSDYGDTNGYVDNFYDAISNSSDATEEFEETLDWIEIRMEEFEEKLSKLNAELENQTTYIAKNAKIDEIIATNRKKYADSLSGAKYYENYAADYLSQIPEQYQAMAKNGSITITDFVGDANEEVVEAIQKYRDYIQKAADLNQQAEEVITEIRDLTIQKIDNIQSYGDAKTSIEDAQTEKLQNAVDLIEESGNIAAAAYYQAMMENSGKKMEYWAPLLENMQKEFDEAVENGTITRGSVEWYEQLSKLYEVQAAIDEAKIELEEFQNAINDIYWENFDQLINRLDYLKSETQSLIDLMANDDLVADPTKRKHEGGTVEYWTADDVNWTDEGLASLGLYAQQMEIAEYTARQYAEAINDLEADYAAGLYSESEYLEKLNELKEAQYENIEAYYEAQDAIVELNEARIDSIKEGIEAEIDAYSELIDKKKEALDAEKDLYDFQRNTTEQQKNIADIERQLAALANDHSLSAAAKRKQLEAELAEAQYELQDTYYNRSVEDKQTALDKELEDFQTEKDAEIAKWEEYLTNVEAVIAESLGVVQANASGIYDTLNQKADEYNIHLSESILAPWNDGALAVSDYQTNFDTAMSSTMNQLDALKNKWQEVIDKMVEASKVNVSNINAENAKYAQADKITPSNTTSSNSNKTSSASSGYNTYTVKSGDSLWAIAKAQLGDANRWGEIYNLNRGIISNPGLIYPGQKLKLPKYAQGTTGVKNDQLAWIDEMGLEEIVLHADGSGKLTYLSKGSAVLPHDISENLMQLGSLDPSVMLDQNRPAIIAPHITNNEISINMNIAEVVHIDEVTNDTLPDLTKVVQKQMDSYMSKLNNAIKAKVR